MLYDQAQTARYVILSAFLRLSHAKTHGPPCWSRASLPSTSSSNNEVRTSTNLFQCAGNSSTTDEVLHQRESNIHQLRMSCSNNDVRTSLNLFQCAGNSPTDRLLPQRSSDILRPPPLCSFSGPLLQSNNVQATIEPHRPLNTIDIRISILRLHSPASSSAPQLVVSTEPLLPNLYIYDNPRSHRSNPRYIPASP